MLSYDRIICQIHLLYMINNSFLNKYSINEREYYDI